MRPRALLLLLLLPMLAGCAAAGRVLENGFRERPPAPRDRLDGASDLRLDSLGVLTGSFIGEGTSRAVHLLTSDTVLIESVVRRYGPETRRTTDFWSGLKPGRTLRVPLREPRAAVETGVLAPVARVASPAGRSAVVATALTVRIGACGARGAQLELLVEPGSRSGPPLTGPVLGSINERAGLEADVWRAPPEPPDSTLVVELLDRTRHVLDSLIRLRYSSLTLDVPASPVILVNTLDDFDAAEVIPYFAGNGRVRYAVSVRERRRAANDTVVVAGVMAWDREGAWQQQILRPTIIRLQRGRAEPYRGAVPLFWRRLAAIADFGFDRDNLWMEQVDVRDGAVLWGIVQPADNVVVAAAEMRGPCSP